MIFLRKKEYEIISSKINESRWNFINFIVVYLTIIVLTYFSNKVNLEYLVFNVIISAIIYIVYNSNDLYQWFSLFIKLFFLSNYDIIQRHPYFTVIEKNIIKKNKIKPNIKKNVAKKK